MSQITRAEGFMVREGKYNPKGKCFKCFEVKKMYFVASTNNYFCKSCLDELVLKYAGKSIKNYTNAELLIMWDSMEEVADLLKKNNYSDFNRGTFVQLLQMMIMVNTRFERVQLSNYGLKGIKMVLSDRDDNEKLYDIAEVNKETKDDVLSILLCMIKGRGV